MLAMPRVQTPVGSIESFTNTGKAAGGLGSPKPHPAHARRQLRSAICIPTRVRLCRKVWMYVRTVRAGWPLKVHAQHILN